MTILERKDINGESFHGIAPTRGCVNIESVDTDRIKEEIYGQLIFFSNKIEDEQTRKVCKVSDHVVLGS